MAHSVSDRMNKHLSRSLSCHYSQRSNMDTNFATRLSDDLIHPVLSSLSCSVMSQLQIRHPSAPLRFFILIPFRLPLSFLPIYLSRHSDCHHHRSHRLLLHSERHPTRLTCSTSRLNCSPDPGVFEPTCSPSANAAASFFATLASVATSSSASRLRCYCCASEIDHRFRVNS